MGVSIKKLKIKKHLIGSILHIKKLYKDMKHIRENISMVKMELCENKENINKLEILLDDTINVLKHSILEVTLI